MIANVRKDDRYAEDARVIIDIVSRPESLYTAKWMAKGYFAMTKELARGCP